MLPKNNGTHSTPPPSPPSTQGPTVPNSVILRMRGVPFSATKQQCKEFFTRATPLDVHLVTEPGGRSKGEAFAEFANETVRAG
jgi:hypothetical protein